MDSLSPLALSFTEETFTAFNVCMPKFLRVFSLPLTAKNYCSHMQYNEAHLDIDESFFIFINRIKSEF